MAILGVIGVHVSTNYTKIVPESLDASGKLLTFLNVFIEVLMRYGVPLFLFISGYVLTQKYSGRFPVGIFYRKRALRLLGPYLIFSIFYVIIYGLLEGWPAPGRLLFVILTASTTIHLWFFRLIVELYLLYPFLLKGYLAFESRRKEWVFFAIVFIVQVAATYIAAVYSNSYSKYLLEVPQFWLYFISGIYLGRNPKVLTWIENLHGRKLWLLVFGMTALTLVLSVFRFAAYMTHNDSLYARKGADILFSFCQPFLVFFGTLISFAVCDFCARYKDISVLTSAVGVYSFGIYLIHPFFMGFIARVFQIVHIDRLHGVFYPLMFFFTLLLSFWAVRLINRTPLSEMTIGVKQNHSQTDSQ